MLGLRTISVLSLIVLCRCQTFAPISEPRLISVIPVNSTTLTVNWQFASASIDRSDLIRISIVFNEFYYSYNRTYAATNYTFTSTNTTITSLSRTFELVNAYYYVCFSSNSTLTNATRFLAIVNNCLLARTCLRSNAACPGPSSAAVQSTEVSSTSFVITFLWPNELPYSPTSFTAQLTNNGQFGSSSSWTQNTSYTARSFRFSGLQSRTTYTVIASVIYMLINGAVQTNVTTLTVTTSSAWRFVGPCDLTMLLFLAFLVTNKSA